MLAMKMKKGEEAERADLLDDAHDRRQRPSHPATAAENKPTHPIQRGTARV
jgi:hypothetical protein